MAVPLKELEDTARDIGKTIGRVCPPGSGFLLVLYDFGHGGNMTYISNGQREDCIRPMKELLEKIEGDHG